MDGSRHVCVCVCVCVKFSKASVKLIDVAIHWFTGCIRIEQEYDYTLSNE